MDRQRKAPNAGERRGQDQERIESSASQNTTSSAACQQVFSNFSRAKGELRAYVLAVGHEDATTARLFAAVRRMYFAARGVVA
jgi:predicted O-linked N-acetylglucosamine transferase (SPINDLY family)